MEFYDMIQNGKLKLYAIYEGEKAPRYGTYITEHMLKNIVYAAENKIIGGEYDGRSTTTFHTSEGKTIIPVTKTNCEVVKKVLENRHEEVTPTSLVKWCYFMYSGNHYEVNLANKTIVKKKDNVITDKKAEMASKMLSDTAINKMIGLEKVNEKIKEYQKEPELSEDEVSKLLNEWNDSADNFYTRVKAQNNQP